MTKYEHTRVIVRGTPAQVTERAELLNKLCSEGWEVWQAHTSVIDLPTEIMLISTYYLRKEVE